MALGKGLSEILEEVGQAYENEINVENGGIDHEMVQEVRELEVDSIDPNPFQPRKNFDQDKLNELANSILHHGLLQPVVVIEYGDRYVLVAGERRLRAHKIAELETIRAIVADVSLDDHKMRELALVENIQRENLNAIELALSYQELLDVHGITHDELSKIVHKSRSQITNTLRLLSLPEYARNMVAEEKISQGHAKVLVGLDPEASKRVVDTIIGQKLSVRDTEKLLQQKKKKELGTAHKSSHQEIFSPEILDKLHRSLPFDYRVKNKKIEILLPNENALMQFIAFISKDKSS